MDLKTLDLDKNGIPDYEEAWPYKLLGKVAMFLIKTFCPPHTIAYRAADAYSAAITQHEADVAVRLGGPTP